VWFLWLLRKFSSESILTLASFGHALDLIKEKVFCIWFITHQLLLYQDIEMMSEAYQVRGH